MTDRDRLIELIRQGKDMTPCEKDNDYNCKGIKCADCESKSIADHLLANGVIVPPCKVGDTVYVPSGDEAEEWIEEYKVKYFYCSSKGINRIYIECGTMGNNFRPKDIGKTVFLTKEEAEKALAERSGNNG